jgi:hypothetical protein
MELLTFITVFKSFPPITFWVHFLQFIILTQQNWTKRLKKRKTYHLNVPLNPILHQFPGL